MGADEVVGVIGKYISEELKIESDSKIKIVSQLFSSVLKHKHNSYKEKDQLSQHLTQQLQHLKEDHSQFQQHIRSLKEQLFHKDKEQAVHQQRLEFMQVEIDELKREKLKSEEMNEKLLVNMNLQETPSKYKMELESHRYQENIKIHQIESEFINKIKQLEHTIEDLQHELHLREQTLLK